MGGGGEYEMQEGFGWTNGVILDLLLTYSDRLSSTTANTCHAHCECQTPTQTGSTVDAQSVCEDHLDNTGENVAPVAPLFEGAPVESRPIFSRKTSIFEPKPDAEPLEPLFAQPRSRTNSLSIFNTAAAPFSPMEAPIFEATPLFDRTNPIVEAYDANNQSRSRLESVGEGFVPRSCTDSFTAADLVPRSRGNSFTTADAPPRSRGNSFTTADAPPRSRVNSFAMPRSRVNSQSVQNGADATPPVEITLPAVMTDELAQSLAATLLSGEVSTSLPQGVDVLPWAESVAPPSFE
uniref:Trehalase n=1 Tax=Plectus sambesii TaxID=2011161 RepID=A0A914X344_9BILA